MKFRYSSLLLAIMALGLLGPSHAMAAVAPLGIDSPVGTDMTIGAAGVEAVIVGGGENAAAGNVDFLGKVGIGTTKPISAIQIRAPGVGQADALLAGGAHSGQLDISDSGHDFTDSNLQALLSFSDRNNYRIGYMGDGTGSGSTMQIVSDYGPIEFYANGAANSYTTSMRISNGNVGVGINTPSYPFHVYSTNGLIANFVSNCPNRTWFGISNNSGSTASGALILGGNATTATNNWEIGNDLGENGGQNLYIYDRSKGLVRMFFDGTGNVGVGTYNPSYPLHVSSTNGLIANFVSSSPNRTWFGISNNNGHTASGALILGGAETGATNNWEIGNDLGENGGQNLYIYDRSKGLVRMFFDGAGRVGIGTYSPAYTLHVEGTAYATGAAGSLSDIRHKDQVETLPLAGIETVNKLRPVSFVWKAPKDDGMKGKQLGFIAQEVEKVLPSAVMTEENEEKTKNLKYNEMIPVLTKAVQELSALNEKQASALKAQEAKLDKQAEEIQALQKKMEKLSK